MVEKKTAKPRKPTARKGPLRGAAKKSAQAGEAKTPDYAAAWQMRVEGQTFREIGEAFNIPLSTAHDWCKRAREANHQEAAEIRKDAREQALARLQPAAALAAKLYAETGQANHAGALASLEKRIADLVGSDAPKAVHVSGTDGGPIRYTTMTDDELRKAAGE
jgi:hypothetical protein